MVRLPLFMACLLIAAAVAAEEVQFVYPDEESIDFTVPDDWSSSVDDASRGMVFESADPFLFKALVTPFWVEEMDGSAGSDANIRNTVQGSADHFASAAAEEKLPLQRIVGHSGGGYYFTATDRAPKPGEYLYMTQGAIAVDGIVLAFTILANPGAGDAIDQALQMIQSARRTRP